MCLYMEKIIYYNVMFARDSVTYSRYVDVFACTGVCTML